MKIDVQHLGKGAFIKILLYVYNISFLEIDCVSCFFYVRR